MMWMPDLNSLRDGGRLNCNFSAQEYVNRNMTDLPCRLAHIFIEI